MESTERRSHERSCKDINPSIMDEQELEESNAKPLDPPSKSPTTSDGPYTLFTKRQKRVLTATLAIISLSSPFTQTVYLPLLPLLAERYKVSILDINLTITFYSIIQAFTPALFAPTSDGAGRRPISLVTFVIYTAASLGLALNKSSYVGLLLLRGVQALGASASVSIAYGVIADVCVQSERGAMIGPVMSAANVGTLVGPILGGLIAWRSKGQAWVFRSLVLFGVVNIIFICVCLPETARNVVGNGSQGRKDKFSVKQWLLIGPKWVESKDIEKNQQQDEGSSDSPKRTLKFARPLSFLKLVLWKDTAFLLIFGGINYAVWNSFLAMIPHIYEQQYGWNQVQVGLAYLPGAVGVIAGGVINGKWMDYKYKKTAKEFDFTVDNVSGDDLTKFPIERARCRDLYLVWAIYNASLASLGWVIHVRTHVAISLVLQALVGFFGTFLFFCFNTLIVDVHPEQPSAAAAAATVVRCGLSAAGVAMLQPLVDAMGRGWYLTMLAILIGGTQGFGLWAMPKWGMSWRERRRKIIKRNQSGPQ